MELTKKGKKSPDDLEPIPAPVPTKMVFDYSFEHPFKVTENDLNLYLNGSVKLENEERCKPANPSLLIPTKTDKTNTNLRIGLSAYTIETLLNSFIKFDTIKAWITHNTMDENGYIYLNTSLADPLVPFLTREYGLGNPVNVKIEVLDLGKVRLLG